MITISSASLEPASDYGHYTAELSELRLGGFPNMLDIPGLGNGQKFVPTRVDRDSTESIQAVKYSQMFGCVHVTIFND